MIRTVSLLTLAATFALTSIAAAGGAKCNHADMASHKAKAAKMAEHGWIGIETKKDESTGAVSIKAVVPGSPAEAAGFRQGDVLVALNGVALNAENKEALKAAKSGLKVGKTVEYTVKRNGAKQQIAATLAPVPQDVLAKWMAEEEEHQKTVAVAQKN